MKEALILLAGTADDQSFCCPKKSMMWAAMVRAMGWSFDPQGVKSETGWNQNPEV